MSGRAGLLVPCADARALALALERLLLDAPLRARLAASGRERAEQLFDIRKNVADLHGRFRRSAALAATPVNPEAPSCARAS